MPKSHLDDLPELRYYVLSLKHSPGHRGHALWWGPSDSGYTEDLCEAGRYTREQIEERPHYYNDGEETLAVREDIAINESRVLRLVGWGGPSWWRERITKRETNTDVPDNREGDHSA